MAIPVQVLDPTWINAPVGVGPTYDSEELRRTQGFTFAAGVTPGSTRTGVLNVRDLVVTLSGSNVMVGPGGAVIGTAKGAYLGGVSAATNAGAFTPADVTNPRRDRIILEVLDPDNGGSAGRKAQLRIVDGTPNAMAATGGGVAAEPVLSLTLGFLDVPKVGAGSPVVTAAPPITAMAGAPIPVRNQSELDALPKWNGLQVTRLDLAGKNMQTCSGADWFPQQLDPIQNANFSAIGAFEVSRNGAQKLVTGQVRITRISGSFSCPAGSYTSIGDPIPLGARGSGEPIYVSAVVVGGVYARGTLAIGGSGGARLSFRPDATFTWPTGTWLDASFSYFI